MNKVTILCGDPSKIDYSKTGFNDPFLERKFLHPKLQVGYTEKFIKTITKFNTIDPNRSCDVMITNSDHIINRLRVAKKNKEIDELYIEFYPFESDKVITIAVDKNGTCSEYPIGFLDEMADEMLLDIKWEEEKLKTKICSTKQKTRRIS